jgi:hypothetical protein
MLRDTQDLYHQPKPFLKHQKKKVIRCQTTFLLLLDITLKSSQIVAT